MNKIVTGILCASLTLGMASAVFASAGTTGGKTPSGKVAGGELAPVVKKAVEACKGKAAGDACTFTGRKDNTINGKCKQRRKADKPLICHPERPVKGTVKGK